MPSITETWLLGWLQKRHNIVLPSFFFFHYSVKQYVRKGSLERLTMKKERETKNYKFRNFLHYRNCKSYILHLAFPLNESLLTANFSLVLFIRLSNITI